MTIDGDSSYRHFNITDGNNANSLAVSITGLRLINGRAITAGSINNFENLTLSDCRLDNNTATGGTEAAGALRIRPEGDATLTNCSFQDNRAHAGGAIYNVSSATPSFTDCSIQGNSADMGGGIYNFVSSPTITNCSFQGNSALSGGGMYNKNSTSSLTSCYFLENSASSGGGIYNDSSTPSLTNCSFLGNRASSGGGVYNNSFSPSLTNCSIQGNSADLGGGMYNFVSSPTITNCSIQGNSAPLRGGGIYNVSSSPFLTNSIIWNNAEADLTNVPGASVANSSSTPTYVYSLIQEWSDGGTNDLGGTTNLHGTNPANDPLFVVEIVPLTAPATGGDLRLLTGSPALDAGDGISGVSANTTATDLAGKPRFAGNGTIDLGVFEGNIDATFALLHPDLDPYADDNFNSRPNLVDYYTGGDPTMEHDPFIRFSGDGSQATFSCRNNDANLVVEFQKSSTLLSGSWVPMIEGVDYEVNSTTITGGKTSVTFDLLPPVTDTDGFFLRQKFTVPQTQVAAEGPEVVKLPIGDTQ